MIRFEIVGGRSVALRTWLARGAGIVTVAISLGHLIRLLWIDNVNGLALWTIVTAAAAGVLAISRPGRAGSAALVLTLAVLLATFGWAGWLYFPPLVVLVSAALAGRAEARGQGGEGTSRQIQA
jgi:hypothetical protein